MHPMNRKKVFSGIVIVAVLVLSLSTPDMTLAESVAGKPFTWNALEASLRQARGIG